MCISIVAWEEGHLCLSPALLLTSGKEVTGQLCEFLLVTQDHWVCPEWQQPHTPGSWSRLIGFAELIRGYSFKAETLLDVTALLDVVSQYSCTLWGLRTCHWGVLWKRDQKWLWQELNRGAFLWVQLEFSFLAVDMKSTGQHGLSPCTVHRSKRVRGSGGPSRTPFNGYLPFSSLLRHDMAICSVMF